jgi:hypothetical protein
MHTAAYSDATSFNASVIDSPLAQKPTTKSHPRLVNALQIRDLFSSVELDFGGAYATAKTILRCMHSFVGHVQSGQKTKRSLVAQILPC